MTQLTITYSFVPDGEGTCTRCGQWQQQTRAIECEGMVIHGPDGYPGRFCAPCLTIFKRGLLAGQATGWTSSDKRPNS